MGKGKSRRNQRHLEKLERQHKRHDRKPLDKTLVLERIAVAFNDEMWPAHYIAVDSQSRTLCGRKVPAVPEEYTLVDTPEMTRIEHMHVCGSCRSIVDKKVEQGHSVRLARKNEGRIDNARSIADELDDLLGDYCL